MREGGDAVVNIGQRTDDCISANDTGLTYGPSYGRGTKTLEIIGEIGMMLVGGDVIANK